MKTINKDIIRTQIDDIDQQLMELLDQRFKLTTEIGGIKKINNDQITDSSREQIIIDKTSAYTFSSKIKKIYEQIFINNKIIQATDYFLIGKDITYSYSKIIHENLAKHKYELLGTNNFDELMKILNFKGLNITNPYKKQAIKYCDKLLPNALKTSLVNTIVKTPEGIIGENTDYDAFKDMLEYYHLNLADEKIGIIGNGNTSKTIQTVFDELKISYLVFARNPKDNEILLSTITNYHDLTTIINVTPYGVYPYIKIDYLFDLTKFKKLNYFIDLNYNPFRTITIPRKVKYYNGLYMLIKQAFLSEVLFNKFYPFNLENCNIKDIMNTILIKKRNIVIIGMPYAGKTTLGKNLSIKLDKNLFDMDDILLSQHHSLEEIKDLTLYRQYENELVKELALLNNAVIVTGGGVIENEENLALLKANGIIIYLKPNLNLLISRIDNTRPLISNTDDLIKLYHKRASIYKKHADIIITSSSLFKQISLIKEGITHENFNH